MSEESEMAEAPSCWKRIGNIFARIVLYGLLLFVLLIVFGAFTWPVELAFHFIAGSFFHGWKNLPPFFSQWRSALLPLACLAIAVMLAHRFILWWIKTKDIRISWRWGHTAAATLLLLLGSAAAIAMSGITHQAAWLSSSSWLENNRKTRLTAAVSNARQIMLVLLEYETTYKKFPDTLEEAMKAMDCPTLMLWVETGPDRVREPFIILKPGHPSTGLVEPVIVSPVVQPYDRVVVGYSDCSARTMPLKAWLRLKEEIQAAHE